MSDVVVTERAFRVMNAPAGCPSYVPWVLLAPHEPQAMRNHGQSLDELNRRGGMDPSEILAVIGDRRWQRMDASEAGRELARLVADTIAQRRGVK